MLDVKIVHIVQCYFCTLRNIRIAISKMATKMAAKHLVYVNSCHHSATMKQLIPQYIVRQINKISIAMN